MPVSLGEWRVRIGRFIRRRKKEYDYNYFWNKLVNLIKRAKNVQSSEENNSECNASPSSPQPRSQCDGPECDAVKESGSSCEEKGPGPTEESISESSCAENSGSPTANETNHVRDTTDVQNPDSRPCTGDTVDDRDIAINLMPPEYPPKSSQISKTDQPEVGTAGSYSHVPAAVPGEPDSIKLNKEETSNSAPSGIEDQSLDFPPKPGQDTTINTDQMTLSMKKETEYQGSPTYPVLGSGTNRGEGYGIKGNDCRDMTNILLLRSGDVERNPGPNDKKSSVANGDFDDILKDIAKGLYKNSDIDDLGKALGFGPADIGRTSKQNAKEGENYLGTLDMLRTWRKRQTTSTEKAALRSVLLEARFDNLADKYLSPPVPGQVDDHIPSMTEEEIKLVTEDVKRYLTIYLCQIQADPLNSELLLKFERIFTNLTLMEEDKGTKHKTPLLYDDLLRTEVNGIYPKRLLVEGEGGVGKTTLCAKIAWDWIHGKGYTNFKLVLVVLLREAKDKTVGEIVKSYLSDNNPVTAKQLDKYIFSNPVDVFLVLDGLDEFAVDLNSKQQIALITLNKLFKSGTVLITSRQWKSDEIRKDTDLRKVFAFIAVEGFSAENLSSYIIKFFDRDPASSEDLNRFISNNDVIRENMAPYPIYTAMLCIMWKEFDGERREAMSKLQTFSQLFDEMFHFLIDHYLSKLGVTSADAHGDLNESRSNIRYHLTCIGSVAFQGLLARRLVFTEYEFRSCPESIDVGCKVGALTKEMHIPSRRERRHYSYSAVSYVQFPHKLFQEYLSGMYLASLYNSNRNEYDMLTANIIYTAGEYQYLLYFTSAQQKEVGSDIVSRLISSPREFTPRPISDVVDVAYESQHQAVAKAVADHLSSKSSKTLKITKNMKAHTVSGHTFIMNHREVDKLTIEKSCGRTASEDLAEFICSSRSLRSVTIASTMHDVFYSVLANKAVDSKIGTLYIRSGDLSKRPSASRDLAQFICKMPHLKNLILGGLSSVRDSHNVSLHDDFYSSSLSMASSAKIQTLDIRSGDLRIRPTASRDFAEFICKMPHLKNLTFSGEHDGQYASLPDDFYSTSVSMASTAKIESLDIRPRYHSIRPSASRDFAEFICKMPHLKNLTLGGGQDRQNVLLHNDFYLTSSSMASSAKIKTLDIRCEDLSTRPSASHDFAEFICKMPHLKNLTLSGRYDWQNVSLHDDFYSTSSSIASSAKIETLGMRCEDLSKRPFASRDFAEFICKMHHLKNLTLGGRYDLDNVSLHDDFYSTSSSMASSAKIETLDIRCEDLSKRPSASRDFAEFICKMPHLKNLTLGGGQDRHNFSLHDNFYSTSSSMASSAKIETLYIRCEDLSKRPSASRDLAQFICKMPRLKNLTLSRKFDWMNVWLHDDFYSTSSPMASSAKIETLAIRCEDLSKRSSASRDIAQFICKMPHLKNLTIGGSDYWQNVLLSDDFYSTSSSMASSAQIETLDIQCEDLSKRPSASRDFAKFICKMPHLKVLTLARVDDRQNVWLHDDFFSTYLSMASSAKIETLDFQYEDLSERPSASHD